MPCSLWLVIWWDVPATPLKSVALEEPPLPTVNVKSDWKSVSPGITPPLYPVVVIVTVTSILDIKSTTALSAKSFDVINWVAAAERLGV